MTSNPQYHSEWYVENRERLLPIRRKYNKEYSTRPEVIERARVKNATPEAKEKRRQYKLSKAGKVAERRYRVKNHQKEKERIETNRLKSRYGLTLADVQRMKELQLGLCALCQQKKERLHIDHCHKTGKVRELLCTTCNMGLGLFRDDVSLLLSAITYLQKHAL